MTTRLARFVILSTVAVVFVAAELNGQQARVRSLARKERRVLSGIAAARLQAHVAFLAGDALEGRGTPSKGLDEAADYIAAQFRASRLEPLGDAGYFQTAAFESVTQVSEGLALAIESAGEGVVVSKERIVHLASSPVDLRRAGIFLADLDDIPATSSDETRGKVVVLDLANVQAWTREQRAARGRVLEDPLAALAPLEAAAIVFNRSKRDSFGGVELRERQGHAGSSTPALVSVNDEAFRRLVAGWKPGPVAATMDLTIPAPAVEPVLLRNVAGVIRGSDRGLRDTYVIVSAHYDHLGMRASGDGDRIYNGANDNASGVAALLEVARSFAASRVAPARSIVFLAFFGEEKSGMGSKWYVRHPLVPLARTVANLNLEQLGRTDDADGPHVGELSVTGLDYSDVGTFVARAGSATAVAVTGRLGDTYFEKADSTFLARAGVPAHTVAVTFEFPGRHTPGDEVGRLDFANMERVTRTVALAVWSLASSSTAPQWHHENAAAQPYAEVARKLAAGS